MNIKNTIKKIIIYNFLFSLFFLSLIYLLDFFCKGIYNNQLSLGLFIIDFVKIELLMVIPISVILIILTIIYYKPVSSYIKILSKNKNNSLIKNKAIKRIYSLNLICFIQNLIGFIIGFIIYILIINNYKNILLSNYIFYLVFIIISSGILSIIQINITGQNLIPLKKILKIRYLENNKKIFNFSLNFNNQFTVILIILYLLSFGAHIQINLIRQNNLYSAVINKSLNTETNDNKIENILVSTSIIKNAENNFKSDIFSRHKSQILIFPIFNLILISSVCFLCLMSNNNFKTQLNNIRITMEKILNGEAKFTERINLLEFNELGNMSDILNNFLDTFKDILENIFSNTGSVYDVSDSLDKSLLNASTAIEQMASSVEQITGNTNKQINIVRDISGKVEEMLVGIDGTFKDIIQLSSFVDETSSAMHESAESIKSVSNNTEKVNELSNNLVEISKKGSNSVFNTINAIKDIENASNDVMEIVDIITNLSSQTDLLAMNAAIEAAHAGEKGKGFAVVADEIRNLAENSKENAAMIIKHIKDMNEKVKNGVFLSNESGKAFKRIDEDINQTTHLIKEVSSAIQEQNIATNEILNSIDSMLTATMEMKEITDDMKFKSEEIHKLMTKLSEVTMEINTATGEQNKGNVEILSLISTVKEASTKNISMVDNLNAIMNTFQVENLSQEKK